MKYRINKEYKDNFIDLVKHHYDLNEFEISQLHDLTLTSPRQLTNLDACIEILRDIKRKNEKILIVGDYDCDGICATAILCKAFSKVGLDYGFYIPNRCSEGYGLNVSILEKAMDKGYKNIITVDNGVKALEAMRFSKEHNLRLIITDHHTYEESDIECACFLHPFLKDDTFTNCSGAGIALQIGLSLIPNDKDIICYACIAAIADCMKPTRENRKIILNGINYLNEGYARCLHALKNKPMDKFDMKTISYQIVPKINSMGRLSDIANVNNAVRYLLLEDERSIEHVASQINHINELRKEKTNEMEKIALGMLKDDEFEILASTQFHEGIVGLLASRLSSSKNKPYIILSENEYEYKGSIRSIEGLDLIEYFKEFDGFYKFGGHAQAAGVTLKKEKYQALADYVKNRKIILEDVDQGIVCEQICETALNIPDVETYRSLEPFGNGFEEILFYIENIQILNKISLSNGKYVKVVSTNNIEYLFFKSELLEKIKNGMKLVGKISVNEFRGNKTMSVLVEDVLEETYE